MKQLKSYVNILIISVLSFGLNACQDDNEGKLAPWMEFTDESGENFPTTLSVGFSGGEYTMNVYTNVEWAITTDVDWLSASPSAKLGCTSGKLVVALNESNEQRSGTFTLETNNSNLPVYKILVTQEAAPKELEAYYVTPDGSGDKDGSDWDNALDVSGFKDLLTNALDMSEMPIYMSEGEYVASGGAFTPTKNISHIYGGYSSESTGTDLTKKAENPTILSGNNANTIFDIMNCNVVFENITFANGYTASDATGSGIRVSGSWSNTSVELINCVVRDCVSGTTGQDGAAISLAGGKTKLNNVQILNNQSVNRGAGICLNEATEGDSYDLSLFLNNCTFSGNKLTADWNWGVDINARRGYVFMNNCTFFGSETLGNNEGPINADAFIVAANTTFIGNTNNSWIVRNNNSDGSQVGFVNCLFINNGAGMSLSTGDNLDSLSKGWNLFQGIDFDLSNTDTDASSFSFGAINAAAGIYEWDANDYSINAFATQADVVRAVQNTNVYGSEFVSWVGESNFALDQRGENRNPNKMQPGAYDANLN